MTNIKTYGRQLRKLVKYLEESKLIYIAKDSGYVFLPERGVFITEFSENTEQHKKGLLAVMYDNEKMSMTLEETMLLIDKVEEGILV